MSTVIIDQMSQAGYRESKQYCSERERQRERAELHWWERRLDHVTGWGWLSIVQHGTGPGSPGHWLSLAGLRNVGCRG